MAAEVDPKILEGFFAEVRGYVPRMRRDLELVDSLEEKDAIDELYRLVHSIKGTASMVGQPQLSRVSGAAEEELDAIRRGERPLDGDAVGRLREAVDAIERYLDRNVPVAAGVDIDEQLLTIISEEFEGYLDEMGACLRDLDRNRGQIELISRLLRPVHTMKGTAGIVGLGSTSHLAHRMEDLLAKLHRAEEPVRDNDLSLLFRTVDQLSDLNSGAPMSAELVSTIAATHEAYDARLFGSDNMASAPADPGDADPGDVDPGKITEPLTRAPAADETPERTAPAPVSETVLRVRADRLDGVLRLLGDVTLQRTGFRRQVSSLGDLRTELHVNLRRLGRIARQLEAELEDGALTSGAVAEADALDPMADFDSLEMDRYTTIDRLTRQLEEAAADAAVVGSGLDGLVRDFEGFQSRLGGLIRDVQERLTNLRTVAFGSLSGRLHRAVRVTADARGKAVDLELVGAEVELDTDIVEEVAEPLLHLLRNAVDHGIETPDERKAAGKTGRGTVRIEVAFEGTEAVIRVADDGRGLHLDRLRKTATERGIMTADEATGAGPESFYPLIFQRGLSTAPEISEISGRGVGLDVVRSSMDRLRGSLAIESRAGEGLVITLRIPGSQTILRTLVVASGGESMAVPLGAVDRVEAVSEADLEASGESRVVTLAGERLRAVDLDALLGVPSSEDAFPASAVIIQLGEERRVILVERILGVQEVVIRPMSDFFASRLYGLAGAALTGEGQVVLVLNPGDLLHAVPVLELTAATSPEQRPLEVLIVDDSLSVRQVLGRLMEVQGWRARGARDGVEALESLQQQARLPDIAVVDLEMPRMDGFELIRALKSQPELAGIPVVILTTRAGGKHRRRAFDLGATEYLVKPYQEQTLLSAIRRAVGSEAAMP